MDKSLDDIIPHMANLTSTSYSIPTILAAVIELPTPTLIVIALVLLTLYCWPVWTRHRYPPGPWPLPFVGHFPWIFVSKNSSEWLAGLSKKYGDVLTVDMNMKDKMVILNSAEAIYDGFVKNADSLSSRPPVNLEQDFMQGKGLINEEDGKWQELRRFALTIFREHGIGRKGIEPVITDELGYFLAALQNTDGSPFDSLDLLTQGVSNIITRVVFGDRFDYSDEKLSNLQFQNYIAILIKTRSLPILKKLPGDLLGLESAKRAAEKGTQFAKDQIEKHKKDIDYDSPPRDYIDAYLIKMREEEHRPDTPFTVKNFLASVMQFYIAGTDTTSGQLYWFYMFAGLYPEVQEKIHQEIKQTLGERTVTYSDRTALPYTNAVCTEIQRFRNVVLGTVFHYSSKDVSVLGVSIPKGTTVRGNIWAVLHNEEHYPDPDTFKPERFLDAEGKYVKPDPKHSVNFGIGRRVCLGEHLARAELFMFFVATLQKFELRLPQGHTADVKGKQGFTFRPEEKYEIMCIPRA